MNKAEIEKQIRIVCRMRRLSLHTERTYADWIRRFGRHVLTCPQLSREEKLRSWLQEMAPHCSASTQNQALNAVVFLYRDVLKQPLGEIGKWARAKRPKKIPVYLEMPEMSALLSALPRGARLMARLAFGTGLRLSELINLRIKDIHLMTDRPTVDVRGGKGDKDRIVPLPKSLVMELHQHVDRMRVIYDEDRAANSAPIYLPDGLERKFPNGGREWPWFWLWPAKSESRDPRAGIVRRHHVHEDTLGKALQKAARVAGLSKRVTAHTLRHSFATHLLAQGADIRRIQDWLGHNSVETTMIYTHCVPRESGDVISPLDALMDRKVIRFAEMTNDECRAERSETDSRRLPEGKRSASMTNGRRRMA